MRLLGSLRLMSGLLCNLVGEVVPKADGVILRIITPISDGQEYGQCNAFLNYVTFCMI